MSGAIKTVVRCGKLEQYLWLNGALVSRADFAAMNTGQDCVRFPIVIITNGGSDDRRTEGVRGVYGQDANVAEPIGDVFGHFSLADLQLPDVSGEAVEDGCNAG